MAAPVANLMVGLVSHIVTDAGCVPATLVKIGANGKQVWLQRDSVEDNGNGKAKIRRDMKGEVLRFDWSEKNRAYGHGMVRIGEWKADLVA